MKIEHPPSNHQESEEIGEVTIALIFLNLIIACSFRCVSARRGLALPPSASHQSRAPAACRDIFLCDTPLHTGEHRCRSTTHAHVPYPKNSLTGLTNSFMHPSSDTTIFRRWLKPAMSCTCRNTREAESKKVSQAAREATMAYLDRTRCGKSPARPRSIKIPITTTMVTCHRHEASSR